MSHAAGGAVGSLWKADADGNHKVKLAEHGGDPIVLSDDRRVLFRASLGGAALSPWLVPLDGGAPTAVTRLTASNRIRLSPNGESILFTTTDSQNQPYVMICDLPSCTSQRRAPVYGRWTPDGKSLAFEKDSNIWVQPLDGKPPRQLTHFTDTTRTIVAFAWSPDGKASRSPARRRRATSSCSKG